MAQKATIADVAARAGVGASTVSRVLNGGQVSAPARARVVAAMSDLAYRPQASARALARGSTGTLGLVIPFFTHPSAIERVRGVLEAVNASPFELVLCNVGSAVQRDEYLGRQAPLDRTDGTADRVARSQRRGGRRLPARRRARRAGRRRPSAAAARGHRRRGRRVAGDAAPDRARSRAHRLRRRHERPALRVRVEYPAARGLPRCARRRRPRHRPRAAALRPARAAGRPPAHDRAALTPGAADRDLRRLGHPGARRPGGRRIRGDRRPGRPLGDRLRRPRGIALRRADHDPATPLRQRPPRPASGCSPS